MASFSELANLSADEVAKVEDSKEARPAMRPYSSEKLAIAVLLARQGEGFPFEPGLFAFAYRTGHT